MWSKIRSVYAWVLLSVIMLVLFPVAFLVCGLLAPLDPRRDRFRVFVATWVSAYGWLTPLYRFRIEGRERLPRGTPYVLVANHESGLDTLAILMLRTPVRFLADRGLFKIPLAGWLFRACRHIPVKPVDRSSGRRALDAVAGSLAEGSPVAIFPEGELMPDSMGEFRAGAFVAAKRASAPIVPVLLEGTGQAWRPGTLVVQGRHHLRIAVLDTVPVEAVAASTPEELSASVRAMIDGARLAPSHDAADTAATLQ